MQLINIINVVPRKSHKPAQSVSFFIKTPFRRSHKSHKWSQTDTKWFQASIRRHELGHKLAQRLRLLCQNAYACVRRHRQCEGFASGNHQRSSKGVDSVGVVRPSDTCLHPQATTAWRFGALPAPDCITGLDSVGVGVLHAAFCIRTHRQCGRFGELQASPCIRRH